MPAIYIKVDTSAVDRKLQEVKSRLTNTRPLMKAITNEMLAETEKAFEREGHPTKWTPLAASTLRQRKRNGREGGKILQPNGGFAGLLSSLQSFHSDEHAGLSSSLPYAAIHQFGGQAGRGHTATIPARPYLPVDENKKLTPDMEQSVMSICENYFKFD